MPFVRQSLRHAGAVSLHHVALGAVDVAVVAEFYRDVLRLAEVRRWTTDDGELRSAWLRLGAGVLMVERAEERRSVDSIAGGPFLLAVGWPEGLDDARRWLGAHAVPIEDATEFTLYARDPEGNRVALSVYPLDAP